MNYKTNRNWQTLDVGTNPLNRSCHVTIRCCDGNGDFSFFIGKYFHEHGSFFVSDALGRTDGFSMSTIEPFFIRHRILGMEVMFLADI